MHIRWKTHFYTILLFKTLKKHKSLLRLVICYIPALPQSALTLTLFFTGLKTV